MTADPFDVPLDVDLATGELLDDRTYADPPAADVVPAVPADVSFLDAAQLAVDTLDGTEVAGRIKRSLQDRLEVAYRTVREQRAGVDGAIPTEAEVRPELQLLQGAAESLRAVGAAFTSAAKDAEAVAGDVVLEVRADRAAQVAAGGSASMRFGAHGGVYLATWAQPTVAWADVDAIVDVLVTDGLGTAAVETPADARAWSAGARYMAELLLSQLLAAPKWKSTALDQLRLSLEADPDTTALADRLRAAYGRKPEGEPRVTIKRQADRT